MLRLALLGLATIAPLLAQIPAFPGAKGFGGHATGGRGGDVYYVTNLNSSGAGSLRYGIDNAPASGRTILFAVSGYIPISNHPSTGDKTLRVVQDNVRIDGSTAPGDGIAVKDGRFLITGDNCIIRNIRIRHGYAGQAGDCLNIQASAQNTIIDHVSMEFSTDEIFSMYESSNVNDVTMQSSIAAWGLESHSKGGLWNVEDATCVDSLWAHNTDRNPKARPVGVLEWINNVTLDYGVGFQMGSTTTPANYKANVIGNYFIHSRYGNSSVALEQARIDRNGNPNFFLWLDDCLHDSDIENYPGSQSGVLNGTDKGFSIVEGDEWDSGETYVEGEYVYVKEASPHPGSTGNVAVVPDDPLTALKKVVSDVGAVRLDAAYGGPIRDEVDALLIDDVLNQRRRQINGEYNLPIGNGGFGVLNSAPSPSDLDLDGMPTFWENAVGHNAAMDDHNTVFPTLAGTFFPAGTPTGYTYLEEYLHFLMVPHITTPRNTVASPSSFTTDLRKFTSGFSNSPSYNLAAISGGTIQQFASNGTTPSATGPIVEFTPTQNHVGRAGFHFTVTDAEGSTWTRQFAILVTEDVFVPPAVRINVDFNEGTLYSGTAAAPDAGTVWNSFPEMLGVQDHTLTDVQATNGSSTPFDVSVNTTSGDGFKVYTDTDAEDGNPNPAGLMGDYAYGGEFTVTVSDLPEGTFLLYVYAHGNVDNQASLVTIDAANGGGSATAGSTGSQWRNIHTSGAEGYSYLKFEPTVGVSGTLVFTVNSYFNGFQLVVPPVENYFVNLTTAAGPTGSTQTLNAMPGWGYSGAAPVPGNSWNIFNESDFNSSFPNPVNVGGTWTIASNVPLTTADGLGAGAALSVVYHADTDALTSDRLNTIFGQGTEQPGGVMEQLMRNYWDRSGNGNFQRFTLGGVTPNRDFLVFAYGASAGPTESWNARIDLDRDGTVDFITNDPNGTATEDALFEDLGGGNFSLTPQGNVWNVGVASSDSAGDLSFDSRGHLCGFQVMEYEAPQIAMQPASQAVGLGDGVNFSVAASGYPEPAYQWYKGGVPITGATEPDYTIPMVEVADLADYTVQASNIGSAVMSSVASLTFSDPAVNCAISHGLDPFTDGHPGNDFDGDGLLNRMECFLGTNLTAADGWDRLPTGHPATTGPAALVFEFDRHKDAAAMAFVVEYALSLTGAWTAAEDGQNGITIDIDVPPAGDYDHVTVTIPTTAPRIYARLRL